MTQLSKQLQAQQAKHKAQSHKLRKEARLEKDRLLDDSERIAQLEMLDRQIEAKEAMRDDLITVISDRQQTLTKQKEAKENELETINKQIIKQQNIHNGLVTKNERIQGEIEISNTDLLSVKRDITTQKNYLKEQEEIVNNTIADWNAQLTEMQQEVETINLDKKLILANITRLEQDKQAKITDAQTAQQKVTDLQTIYDNKMAEMRLELTAKQSELKIAAEDLEAIIQAHKQREIVLASREKATVVTELSVQSQMAELQAQQKRVAMNLPML